MLVGLQPLQKFLNFTPCLQLSLRSGNFEVGHIVFDTVIILLFLHKLCFNLKMFTLEAFYHSI